MKRIVIICAVLLSIFAFTALAEMPLDLITSFEGEVEHHPMCEGIMSPGDLNGDGFDELFVGEITTTSRLLAFFGGNPPDQVPDWMIENDRSYRRFVPDINGDGYSDLVMVLPPNGAIESVGILFGGPGLLSKSDYDLVLSQRNDTVSSFGQGMYSGDVNGDSYNDLAITALNMETVPYEGRITIFYGGDILDSIADDCINFYFDSDGFRSFWGGIGLGDINGDRLLDYGYSMEYVPDDLRKLCIILGDIPLDSLPTYVIAPPFEISSKPGSFGDVIVPLGDINKDGYDDFAVGGSNLWPCVFYGGDPFDTVPVVLGDLLDPSTRGNVISNVGDINHDGWDDIGVGYEGWALQDGIVHVYFGDVVIDGEPDLTFNSADATPRANGHFGHSVGSAGDFNGDGIDDIAISADQYILGARGMVWVYAGDSSFAVAADEVDDTEQLPNGHILLEQNYPNPFNTETTIRYSLSGHAEREIELSIFDILGRRIRTLKDCSESGGVHSAAWDGTDNEGEPVSSGVYFYRLKSDSETLTKKMLLVK